jgi:sRNA-binding protein
MSKRHRSRPVITQTIARLVELYPAAFSVETPRPLAIGIDKAVLQAAPEIKVAHLRSALARYTGSAAYLRAVFAAGAQRVDLNGTAIEMVTPAAATLAVKRLAELKARRQARIAAQAAAVKVENPGQRQAKDTPATALATPPVASSRTGDPAPRSTGTSLAGLRAAATARRARSQAAQSTTNEA